MPAVGASWLWASLGFACYSKLREPARKRPFHLSYVSIKDLWGPAAACEDGQSKSSARTPFIKRCVSGLQARRYKDQCSS